MEKVWITTTEAAELTGYHVDHVRRLVLAGKIEARKFGRDWQVNKGNLMDYFRKAAKQGHKRGPKPRI